MSENAWSSCLLVFDFVVNRWHVFAFEIILLCPLCSSFCSDFMGSGKAFSVDLVPAE